MIEFKGDIDIVAGYHHSATAGKKIVIKPGFKAHTGGQFSAVISEVRTKNSDLQNYAFDPYDAITRKPCLDDWRLSAEDLIGTDTEANQITLNIFPNPAEDMVTLSGKFSEGNVSVFRLDGQKVLNLNHVTPGQSINISDLPSGLYLLVLKNDNFATTQKLQKH